jgi:hypothetical protein
VVPKVTATCVGNAKYFGGGMNIAPTADPFNGGLEVRNYHLLGARCVSLVHQLAVHQQVLFDENSWLCISELIPVIVLVAGGFTYGL